MQTNEVLQVFDNGRDIDFQSHVESYQRLQKYYLMAPYLTLSIIRYVLRVKWSNQGKRVALLCYSY